MTPRGAHVTVSFAETLHFERLVQFLCDADEMARDRRDDELAAMVRECRNDLLGIPVDERD